MKKIKIYNKKTKKHEIHAELTKMEKFDLMRRNNKLLRDPNNVGKDLTDDEWMTIFRDTVSFADIDTTMVDKDSDNNMFIYD